MATFPDIAPNSRTYNFGQFPIYMESVGTGSPMRFKQWGDAQNFELTLGFVGLSDEQANLIREHFQRQGGSYRSFLLPPSIWSGHTFTGDIVPLTMLWRYADAPTEEHTTPGNVNIKIDFVSDGASDFDFTVDTSISPGAATA